MIDDVLETIKRGSSYIYDLGMKGNYITVMFIFPRPWQSPLLYTHSLDRDTLALTKQQSDAIGRGDMTRLDLQYLAVMKDAMEQIEANGKAVDDKVFLFGFSASSDFASRFSLIHPEIVKGIVINAAPTMPFSSYNGVDLKFPLGISDLKELTGSAFNEEAYKKIPQFWHSGSVDGNDGTYFQDGWGNYGDPSKDGNQEGIDYRKAFGNEITARKRLISTVLQEKGFTNIIFKEYAGKSHEFTGDMQTDALAFLEKIN
jgi:pimeloyl-ACP methyl ester carboxylesterase